MILKFKDSSTLETIAVTGSKRFYQNANRDTLEFAFDKNKYTFEQLEQIFADKQKTQQIYIVNPTDNSEFLHEGYILRVSMSLTPVVITPETPDSPEITTEQYFVVMVQQTYMEKQIENLVSGNQEV